MRAQLDRNRLRNLPFAIGSLVRLELLYAPPSPSAV